MGPFRARVEKLEESNLHLAPDLANLNQEEEKLPDANDMDQSLWYFLDASRSDEELEHPQAPNTTDAGCEAFFPFEICRDPNNVWIKNRV